MKFFIDTANVEEIKKANDMGIICGVTTNPSLIAKEGRDFKEVIKEITSIVDGAISGEVKATTVTAEDMIKEAREIAEKRLIASKSISNKKEVISFDDLFNKIKSGTKVSKILSLNKEIALALAAKDVRIQAPIPGKSTIGIDIPNKVTTPVSLREVLSAIPKEKADSKLLAVLGKDIMGRTCCADLSKMPHLLVAGSTGSGKSVCINSILASILMRTKPDEVKLVLVDPKKINNMLETPIAESGHYFP